MKKKTRFDTEKKTIEYQMLMYKATSLPRNQEGSSLEVAKVYLSSIFNFFDEKLFTEKSLAPDYKALALQILCTKCYLMYKINF